MEPMDTVGSVLCLVFRWFLFPVVYISVFAALVLFVSVVVAGPSAPVGRPPRSYSAFVRRLVAALLPFVVLVFMISLDTEVLGGLDLILGHPWIAFLAGFLLVEFGRSLWKTHAEIVWVLYAFVSSGLGCTLLYLTMLRLATPVHWVVLGFITGAGVCIIVRGLPE